MTGLASLAVPAEMLWAAVLLCAVLLVYAAMLRGWRRRGRGHDLAPLVDAVGAGAEPAPLSAEGTYLGTTVSGAWLDRVVARGLGPRSVTSLLLRDGGVDVLRTAGGFRIPTQALRGARHDQGIAGKVVPPHGVLVVTWRHGDHLLDTGFRLADSGAHGTWIDAIDTLAKERCA